MIIILTPEDLINPEKAADFEKITLFDFKEHVKPTLYYSGHIVFDNGVNQKILDDDRRDSLSTKKFPYGKRFAFCNCSPNSEAMTSASSLDEAMPTTT